jgi:hypothetical protein
MPQEGLENRQGLIALRGFDKFAGSEFGRTTCARRADTKDGFGQSHPLRHYIKKNNALDPLWANSIVFFAAEWPFNPITGELHPLRKSQVDRGSQLLIQFNLAWAPTLVKPGV